MRLYVCLFVSLLYFHIPTYSLGYFQVEPRVSISGTYTLHDIFLKIEAQTGKRIFYANGILNDQEKVTVKVSSKTISEVLSQALTGKKLEWSIEPGFIAIVEIRNQPTTKSTVTDADTTITVTGRVTDEKGEPIPGATVHVKGTSNGTSARIDGSFVLRNVRANAFLAISSIQYQTKELHSKGNLGTIQLKEFVGNLDETVVIAYGKTTNRLNTGNVSSLKAVDIEKQPVNNVLLALTARIPGLFVTQATGFSGTGVTVQIRGQNSINSGNDPFYVVDGVPFTLQLLPSVGNILGNSGTSPNSQAGNPLSFINPGNIESISVLKDADATAIYGSRAANGAILITTKKGKAGQSRVNMNVETGWGKVAHKLDFLDNTQYLQMRREAIKNDGTTVQPTDYDINNTWDTTRHTDWQKELIGRTAQYNNYGANVSGGSAQTQYLVGANYHRETTVFPGSFSDTRAAVNFNINTASVNNKFHLQLTGNYIIDNNKLPQTDLTDYISLAPNAPALHNADGTINWALNNAGASTWINPLSQLYNTYSNTTNSLISSATLSYQIMKGLELKTGFGYTNLVTDEIALLPLSSTAPENRPYTSRAAVYGDNKINSWIIEPQLTYTTNIQQLRLEALAGTTIQQNNSTGKRVIGFGYNSDQVMDDLASAASSFVLPTTIAIYKYNAVFGRLNLNLSDKYIMNITARRDGSSRFGSENRFHNFSAIGAAWIFSKEDFIRQTLPFLSFGKLRASYGTTGNDQIPDYLFLSQYTPVTVSGIPYQSTIGLAPLGLTNPYLQWEETKKMETGADLGFLHDKILFNISYFQNRSSNQLIPYTLSVVSGFSNLIRNFPANVQNSGWEFSLNTTNLTLKDFTWTSSINLSVLKNKLISFPNLNTSNYRDALAIGQPITNKKVFKSTGVDPTTGAYTFVSKTDPSNPSFPDDATVVVNTAPKYFGGFQNSLTYKSFQLDFVFQFVKQIGPNYEHGRILPGVAGINQPTTILGRWQKPGDKTTIQRFNADRGLFGQFLNNTTISDAGYTDASFIRLKNLSFSWQIPASWRKSVHLQNARIYTHAQNLFTITNYKGLDPEARGIFTLPPLRTITIGIQVSL
jgi:TonB-linked SusC/RagA family outer membrane protein